MKDTEDEDIGFSGIGKRIESLKNDITEEDIIDWKQEIETETPRQTEADSTKKQSLPKVYKQNVRSPFRFSLRKVFWGVAAIVVIAVLLSQNHNQNKIDSTPSDSTSTQDSTSKMPDFSFLPDQSNPSDSTPSQDSTPFSPDGQNVTKEKETNPYLEEFPRPKLTDGQYKCDQYNNNMAQKLKPDMAEKEDIERRQQIMNEENDALDLLKKQIDNDYVNSYSQSDVTRHNMLVKEYNSRINIFRVDVSNMQKRIMDYNTQVNNYNSYLKTNCR